MKRLSKPGFLATAVTLVLILLAASAAWAEKKEVLIGYSGPMSGLAAEYGQDVYNGIRMAVDEINEKGGFGVDGETYTFRLQMLDDRADPTQAASNARRLRNNGAIAVFNPVYSTSAAMMNINEREGNEFLVMAFTSTPRITDAGNALLLVTPGSFVSMARISAQWAMEKGWDQCAMVVTIGPYGEEWRKVFREIWEEMGGTITADRPANYYTETDFSSPITAALATRPEVMLIGGPSATTALVIEQARMMGFRGGFILIDQAKLDYIKNVMGGTELMGDLIGSAGAGIPSREGQDFATRYRALYGRAATAESSFNYTFVYALKRAIQAAGTTTDVYAIREAFPEAFPMFATEFPMEAYGVTDEGRLLVTTATQTITDGELDKPAIYFWWPETEEEFRAVEAISEIDRSIPRKWLRTPQGD